MTDQELPALYGCPTCGNDEVVHYEKVWARRPILGVRADGVIAIEGLAEINWEADASDEEFFCTHCKRTWPVPPNIDFV